MSKANPMHVCYRNILLLVLIIQAMLAQLSAQESDTTFARKLFEAGQAYMNKSSFDSAYLQFEKAGAIYLEKEAWPLYLTGITGMGKAQQMRGLYQESVELLEAARTLTASKIDTMDMALAHLLNRLGTGCYLLQRYAQAQKHYRTSLKIGKFRQGEHSADIAMFYSNLGISYALEGYSDKALPFLLKALETYKAIGQPEHPKSATTLLGIGVAFDEKGDYENSIIHANKAIQLTLNSPNKKSYNLGNAYNNMAVSYQKAENFDKAIVYFLKGIEVFQEIFSDDHPIIATLYGNLAVSFQNKKAFGQAIIYNQKGIDIFLKHFGPNYPELGLAYNNRGLIYAGKKNWDEALAYYQKSKEVHLKNPNPNKKMLSITLKNIGDAWVQKGHWEEAESNFIEALKIRKKILWEFHPLTAAIYNDIGNMYLSKGGLEEAIEAFDKAISIQYRENQTKNTERLISVFRKPVLLTALTSKLQAYRQLYEKTSNSSLLDQMIEISAEASDLVDLMRSEYFDPATKNALAENGKGAFEQGIFAASERYRMAKDSPQSKTYLQNAYLLATKGKSAQLRAYLTDIHALKFAGIPRETLVQEKQIKIDLAFYEKKAFEETLKASNKDSAKLAYWKEMAFETRRKYDRFSKNLEKNFPQYFALKYTEQIPGIEQIQKFLQKDKSTLIEYYAGETTLYMFSLDAENIQLYAIPWDTKWKNNLLTFVHQIRDPNLADQQGNAPALITAFGNATYELYTYLLEPGLTKKEGNSSLIIVPDGILGYLPFDILTTHTPKKSFSSYRDLPYLLNDWEIRYSYGAGFLDGSLFSKKKSAKNYAGFAPSYDTELLALARTSSELVNFGSLGFLENNQPEVADISDLMNGKSYLGKAATEHTFKQQGPGHQILHLAMHALVNDSLPMYSGLIFSPSGDREVNDPFDSLNTGDDGFLHAYEIYNLELNAELVTLSACNTGHGKLAKGEGILSLARAFRYSGCPNILMSLWQADDQATAEIMRYFYGYLKQGVPKGKALQLAKKDFLSTTYLKHPFYWASFVMLGDNEPVEQGAGWGWWGLGLMLVLAGGWFAWRWKK